MYESLIASLRNVSEYDSGYAKLMYDAADAVEALSVVVRAQKAVLDKFPRWIPVTERLPEPKFAREWYLVALESGCVKSLAYEKEGRTDNLFRPGWHETASPVTHWMPLPEPPKEESNGV
jgi:hypothetical protein